MELKTNQSEVIASIINPSIETAQYNLRVLRDKNKPNINLEYVEQSYNRTLDETQLFYDANIAEYAKSGLEAHTVANRVESIVEVETLLKGLINKLDAIKLELPLITNENISEAVKLSEQMQSIRYLSGNAKDASNLPSMHRYVREMYSSIFDYNQKTQS